MGRCWDQRPCGRCLSRWTSSSRTQTTSCSCRPAGEDVAFGSANTSRGGRLYAKEGSSVTCLVTAGPVQRSAARSGGVAAVVGALLLLVALLLLPVSAVLCCGRIAHAEVPSPGTSAVATVSVRLAPLVRGLSEDGTSLVRRPAAQEAVALARSEQVARRVLRRDDLPKESFADPDELQAATTVTAIDARTIAFRVEAESAGRARATARALAGAYLAERGEESLELLRAAGVVIGQAYQDAELELDGVEGALARDPGAEGRRRLRKRRDELRSDLALRRRLFMALREEADAGAVGRIQGVEVAESDPASVAPQPNVPAPLVGAGGTDPALRPTLVLAGLAAALVAALFGAFGSRGSAAKQRQRARVPGAGSRPAVLVVSALAVLVGVGVALRPLATLVAVLTLAAVTLLAVRPERSSS